MDLFGILALSGSGMSAQRSRMSVVSGNLANAETTRTPEGGPYRRRNVVFRTAPAQEEFSTPAAGPATLRPGSGQASLGSGHPDWFKTGLRDRSKGVLAVEVEGIRESPRVPKKVYDPHHPDANAEGYVSYPDINTMEEMMDLLSAVRSYEANLTAFNASKTLIRHLLEISRTP
jgi:flagellar basal-body rod protein FlgC